MIELFLTGIVIGILVSCPMGPIGMLCIQRTLSKGQLSGFCSGLGAAFSDLFYAIGACLFMGLLVNFIEAHERSLQIFGSIIIILFGYYIFRTDPAKNLKPNQELRQTHVQDFVTAFLLTFSNILVVILLIGLFAQFGFILPEHTIQMTVSGIIGIFAGAVLWWLFITFAVSLMRHWFNVKGIRLLNKLMGIVMMSLAVIGFVASVWFM